MKKKENFDNVSKKLIDSKVSIVLIIMIGCLIMFFSYYLYFSPMAQCVKSLQKNDSRMRDHIAKIYCMDSFGIK